MEILLIADQAQYDEMTQKLHTSYATINNHAATLSFTHLTQDENPAPLLATHDIIIDLFFDVQPQRINNYNTVFMHNKALLLNATWHSIATAINHYCTQPIRFNAIGINGLPTFINRPLWEVSLPNDTAEYRELAHRTLSLLGIEYRFIDDRIGLVTPRMVCMIINEAYFLLQEQGATAQDINIAMKLGVNYPEGPFEWAKKIGINNVIKTLDAIYNDTKDERYRICPLLKRQWNNNQAL